MQFFAITSQFLRRRIVSEKKNLACVLLCLWIIILILQRILQNLYLSVYYYIYLMVYYNNVFIERKSRPYNVCYNIDDNVMRGNI